MNKLFRKMDSTHAIATASLASLIVLGSALAGPYDPRPFSESENTVTNAYIAYYGRAADPAGLAYWSERLEQEGGNLDSIIQAFGESQEFRERFSGLSTVQLISNIYQQLFNRDPDPAGLAYYRGELESGRKTLQTIALDVLYGTTGSDIAILANKFAVSQYFTTAMGAASREVIGSVDDDAMADLLAQVTGDSNLMPGMLCRARGVIFGETPNTIDGRSPAQQAFVSSRGYPDLFSVSFITEELDNNGFVAALDLPVRLDNWAYTQGHHFTSSLFENGYFVEETAHGDGLSLPPNPYSPDQFTLCMTESDVEMLFGEPSCIHAYDLAGRSYRLLRYDPTPDAPALTVALEDGLFVAVTAGFGLADLVEDSDSLCE